MASALLIVDVQNDFTEGGALGVEHGDEVAASITRYLAAHAGEYDLVVASRDWHDADSTNGGHFAGVVENGHFVAGQPDFVNTWPVHCVAETPGAEYDPELDTSAVTTHVRKGQGKPAYSLFDGIADEGRPVAELLDEHHVTDVDVTGIATDFCVRASALDALAAGYRVRVLTDLIAGVAPASSEIALAEMASAGATLTTSAG